MKKTIKDLFKLITAIATVAGILYVARDQIKAIIAKIKEVSDDDFDDDFDDESFDDDSFDDDSFDDDEIFPEPSKDDRDYVSINITDTDDDDPSVVEEESQETETFVNRKKTDEKNYLICLFFLYHHFFGILTFFAFEYFPKYFLD